MVIIDKKKLSVMSMDEIYCVLEEEQFFINAEKLINDSEIQSLIGKLLCDYLKEINCLFINRHFDAHGSLLIIKILFAPSNNIIVNLLKKVEYRFPMGETMRKVDEIINITTIFNLLADDFYDKLYICNG